MNKDLILMRACVKDGVQELFLKGNKKIFEFPLDDFIVNEIKKVIKTMRDDDSDFEIFKHKDTLSILWKSLIEKSIKCLRLFDKREPFTNKKSFNDPLFDVFENKEPSAYGIDVLYNYYMKNTKFENILYGASKYYRDHVVHVLRTWLTGIMRLVEGLYLEEINIKINENDIIEVNNCEKLSIWTIIALTHDLGYPLEKAKEVIDTTNDMVATFITNPNISMDLSFHGVQNYMNDFILRLMSSKMEKMKPEQDSYYARLQPKYYFKFQKSLEKMDHGIISTIIIYKLLTYFLESDYNINEDYPFKEEDRRQFYIRREILRSIASHTCKDIYHLYMCSFSFLLIVADDTQEWGRKYISELYVESGNEYELNKLELNTSDNKNKRCEIIEDFKLRDKNDVSSIKNLLYRLHKQALSYVMMFRDGQETNLRDFSFTKTCNVICNITYGDNDATITMELILDINNCKQSSFLGKIKYANDNDINKEFGEEFFKGLFLEPKEKSLVSWNLEGVNNNDRENPKKWKRGVVSFPLAY